MHLKKHKYWNIVIKFYNWMPSSTVPYIFSLPDPLTHFFLFLVLICQNCFESIEWKEHSFKYIKRYIDALTTPKGCAATTSTSPTFSLPSFPQQLFPFHPLCSAWNRPSYQFYVSQDRSTQQENSKCTFSRDVYSVDELLAIAISSEQFSIVDLHFDPKTCKNKKKMPFDW